MNVRASIVAHTYILYRLLSLINEEKAITLIHVTSTASELLSYLGETEKVKGRQKEEGGKKVLG
jgi:hypothetical protein